MHKTHSIQKNKKEETTIKQTYPSIVTATASLVNCKLFVNNKLFDSTNLKLFELNTNNNDDKSYNDHGCHFRAIGRKNRFFEMVRKNCRFWTRKWTDILRE